MSSHSLCKAHKTRNVIFVLSLHLTHDGCLNFNVEDSHGS